MHLHVDLEIEQEVRHVEAHIPNRLPALQRLSARLATQRCPCCMQLSVDPFQAQQVLKQGIVSGHDLQHQYISDTSP